MKNSVIELDLRESDCVSPALFAFAIEEFPSLKRMDLSECPRITVADIINVFTVFVDRHNET
jgi:hypothetical protein